MTHMAELGRRSGWHESRKLATRLAIMQAARSLEADGQRQTTVALAARAGVHRSTVYSHFPKLADALNPMSSPEQFDSYMRCLAERPAGESPMCMAVHAFHAALVAVGSDPGMLEDLQEKALMASTATGSAAVHFDFVENWLPALLDVLAERHGRRPGKEEMAAAYQMFTLCPVTLATWHLEGFGRPIHEVAADMLVFNGHRLDGGPCPLSQSTGPA